MELAQRCAPYCLAKPFVCHVNGVYVHIAAVMQNDSQNCMISSFCKSLRIRSWTITLVKHRETPYLDFDCIRFFLFNDRTASSLLTASLDIRLWDRRYGDFQEPLPLQ